MAKIDRYGGNLLPFAINATGTERTVFGDSGTQSDTLDDNINVDFLVGWENGLDTNGFPPSEYFNATTYVSTAVAAYLYQQGIAEWHTSQEFFIGSVTKASDYRLKQSISGTSGSPNTGNDPVNDSTNWLDILGNNKLSFTFASDADDTLTDIENLYNAIEIQSGVITAQRNLIISNAKRDIEVKNLNANSVLVKTSAGTGVVIPSGNTAFIRCDGTNVINQAINEGLIGIGQTWQDVKASRLINTDYTNTTGRPIVVSVAMSDTAPCTLVVDGVTVGYVTNNNVISCVSAIVPNGSTYRVSGAAPVFIQTWSELR